MPAPHDFISSPSVSSPHAFTWRNAGWVALAGLILFIRKTDAFLNPQFWAEDFWPFFLQANTLGRTSFWWEYNGYHHFLPRLIATLAAPLDPQFQPAAYVFAALFVTLAMVAQALSPRLDLPAKPLLALAIVIVPHTGEIFLNSTNLQWVTALGLLLTVLKRDPTGLGNWCMDLVMIFAGGLTGPFSVLFAPLFFVRALQRRTTASWLLLGAIAIPALVQGWYISHAAGFPSPGALQPAGLLGVLSVRLVMTLAVGASWAVALGYGWTTALATLFTVVLILSIGRPHPLRASRLILFAALVLVMASAIKRIRPDTWAFSDTVNGDRYFYIPKVIMLWLWVLAFATLRGGWQRVTGFAILGASLAVNLPSFRLAPLPDLKWAVYCEKMRAGECVEVPINPGWKVTYPAQGHH